MASIRDESPPDKKRKKPIRKFKGPNDAIKKTAVVLRERDVFKREETDEVFMPTTITMFNDINRNPELRKQISFTKSMKSDDVEDLLKKTFPVLANTERFYCAKAVQKEKLDFCGERRIWSGEVLNREIKGHSVLYIYCEEDQIQDSSQFSTDSGQSGADDLQEQTRTTTLISQFESVKISEKDEVNKTSHKQALMETFTAKGSQSYPQLAVSEVNQQYTCVTGIPPSFLARHTTDLSLLDHLPATEAVLSDGVPNLPQNNVQNVSFSESMVQDRRGNDSEGHEVHVLRPNVPVEHDEGGGCSHGIVAGHSSDTYDSGIDSSNDGGPLLVNIREDYDVQLYFPMEQDMVEAPSLEEMLFSKYLCHSSLTVTPTNAVNANIQANTGSASSNGFNAVNSNSQARTSSASSSGSNAVNSNNQTNTSSASSSGSNAVYSHSQANTSSASFSGSNAFHSNSQANTSSASSSGSNIAASSTATLVTNARSGRPIMTSAVPSLHLPTSTSGSQQQNNSSSRRPIITPAMSSVSLPSTGFNAASPSMATLVTNASSRQPTVTPAVSSLSLPTNGRETRRYITQLARNSIRTDEHQLQIDDSDDEELLQSPFRDNGDTIIIIPSPQVPQQQARQRRTRPAVTSTTTRPTSCSTSGFHGSPFYGDGMQVGTVREDLSLHGIRDVSQPVGDVERREGAKGGEEEEKQEKEKEVDKGVSNKEETMDNGDKGGNGGIPAGAVEKEHEEEMREREMEIEGKQGGTKKRRREWMTTAKRKKAKKELAT